jgi:hypothetical protein
MTTDGVFWQISGKWQFRALRAWKRPGTGPGLACWFGVEPPGGIEPPTPSLPFVLSCTYREWVQLSVTGVTVVDRQEPTEPGVDGTGMARSPVAEPCGAPVLREQDRIDRPGMAGPITGQGGATG